MTINDTAQVLDILKVTYPHTYKNFTDEEKAQFLKVWSGMLKDYDLKLVLLAVKACLATDKKGFPPSPGMVIEKIVEMQHSAIHAMDAWILVRKAVGNSIYHAEKEFEALPEEIQKAIGSPRTLREWATAEGENVDTVIQSNFVKQFERRTVREKEFQALPSDVQEFIKISSEKLSIRTEKRQEDAEQIPEKKEQERVETIPIFVKEMINKMKIK